MNQQSLSSLIWSVADLLRGDYKQSEYGKVILPFTVLRRLDCVLEPTKEAVLAEQTARKKQGLNAEPFLLRKAKQSFYNTSPLDMKKLMGDQDHIRENLFAYIQAFSSAVRDIFERFEFYAQIDRLAKAGLLYLVTERFAQVDLHPDKVSNSQMGLVFEELIRKFAEISNETAGEHFTPREVIRLMVNLLFIEDDDVLAKPGVVRTIYDPTAGTGGMLSVAGEYLTEHNPQARLTMFGQELNPESYAICKADMLIKGQDVANIVFGNTFSEDGHPHKKFDYMLSNPPFGVEWKKVEKEVRKEYETQGFNGRFGPGLPRVSDGSLLFLLHLLSKMRPAAEGGSRFGIVLNGSPLFTGGAGSGESDIRRYVLENDLVEAVIGLPTDMFYNTGISTYVWILSNRKPKHRKGKTQLVDASGFWKKMRKSLGSKRKELADEHITEITRLFGQFIESSEGKKPISRIFKNTEFGYRTITVEQPLRDEKGKIVQGEKGKLKGRPQPDANLRDTENIPLSEDVESYFKREVLVHVPDAWIDHEKTKVGYEIAFNRFFYVFDVTKLTYTPTGLIATITDAQNNVTSYQYDPRGNRTAVIDPVNGPSHPTSFTYDIMSRLLSISYPDGSTVSFTYDVRGRRITATDQNNKTTTYAYDDADRLTEVTDPALNNTQYAYDTEDNLLSITDANNHVTQFAYNARGWVTQTTFPSTLAESYTYDLVGNLLSKTDRKNQTIQYVYDALYRLTSKTYPDTTAVEYAYDLGGKVQQVSDPTGTYGFSYDNMGRLIGTSTQYSYLPGFNFQNAYTYDAASNRTSLTAPDGSVSTYGYDTLNRLNGLANSWAGSFGFSYDALSRRTQLTRPNGIATNYSYDSVSHLLSVLHQAGANTLDGASYTYDPAGNRTAKTNDLNAVTSNYSYDPLYELTQVTQGSSTTETYSYDPVGNRLSSLGMPTYSYNSSNELTSNSSGSYAYDANGNTLSDASGRQYTWDFENRLTQAVVPGTNGGTTTFKYDPFGRRIQKSGPLGTTNYLYDGFQLVQEIDQSGNSLSRYTQDRAIDEPLAQLSAGATSYYERDGVNTISSLSNSGAGVANTYTYDSFGKLIASSGTVTNPFQYTGREFDSETGIYNYLARYYDPSIGRFLSEDPIQFQGGVDFYAYVSNNPINYADPSGLKRTCITKIMLVTAYCGGNPRTASGKRPGPGTVATANTNSSRRSNPQPIPYAFGCDVTVDNAATNGDWITEYAGTIQDTGAGWDSWWKDPWHNHHDVLPDAWIDIWICPVKKARQWGDKYRTVTICCGSCGD